MQQLHAVGSILTPDATSEVFYILTNREMW
jgi:hypothetical protein